jgi:hypothetical protein
MRECWPALFFAAPLIGLVLAARGILPGTHEPSVGTSTRIWIYTGVVGALIHATFCIYLYPYPEGSMVSRGSGIWRLAFYPQSILVFFLPPDYWIKYGENGVAHINFIHFWGKMLVAFPASLAYALILVGGLSELACLCNPALRGLGSARRIAD